MEKSKEYNLLKIVDLLDAQNREIIHENINDQWLKETTNKKIEDLNMRIKLKDNDITIRYNEKLELENQSKEVQENIEKLLIELKNLASSLKMCTNYTEYLERASKKCSLFKDKVDRVNEELVNDITKFNSEFRSKKSTFEREVKEYESFINEEKAEVKKQLEENNKRYEEQRLESVELQKEENEYLQARAEMQKNFLQIHSDTENASAQQVEIKDKLAQEMKINSTENEREIELCEAEIEDLNEILQKIKLSDSVSNKICKEKQGELDNQELILDRLKENKSNLEERAVTQEQIYKNIENEYNSLKETNNEEFSVIQLKLNEAENVHNTLLTRNSEMEQQKSILENKSKTSSDTMQYLTSKLADVNMCQQNIEIRIENTENSINKLKSEEEAEYTAIILEDKEEKQSGDRLKESNKLLKENVDSQKTRLLEIGNNIVNLKMNTDTRNYSDKHSIEKYNLESEKLKQELEINQNKTMDFSVQVENQIKNVKESVQQNLEKLNESSRTYKLNKDKFFEEENQRLIDKIKELHNRKESKTKSIEDLKKVHLEVKDDIKHWATIIENLDVTPCQTKQMSKFLCDVKRTPASPSAPVNMLNMTPMYNFPKRQAAVAAANNWKNAWSGSTTDEIFSETDNNRKPDKQDVRTIEILSSSDSEDEIATKKAKTVGNKKGGKGGTKGRKRKD